MIFKYFIFNWTLTDMEFRPALANFEGELC